MLEVNQVDAGQPGEFFYAEVEFATEDAARAWQPGALAGYLENEVTGTPGESMAAYWCATRAIWPTNTGWSNSRRESFPQIRRVFHGFRQVFNIGVFPGVWKTRPSSKISVKPGEKLKKIRYQE